MSNNLCAITDCYIRGRHEDDCTDRDTCTGCLPGLAGDGIRICNWHHKRALTTLRDLPRLDHDLGLALVPATSGVKPYSAGGGYDKGIGIDLDVHVFEARDWLRNSLANLAAYVLTERGLHLRPTETVPSLCAWLDRNADWMSANPVTCTSWPQLMSGLRAEVYRRAYRTRQTSVKIGSCPMTSAEGAVCGETIRHDPSDYAGQQIVCRSCGTTGTLDWWQAAISGDGQLLNADAVAGLLTTRYNRVVPPSTIRSWASKGIIGRQAAADGRTVYDISEVRAHADTIWNPAATQEPA